MTSTVDLHAVNQADLWYVLGLIATDGCISGDGRHVNITSADRLYLATVREVLGLRNAIGKKHNGPRTFGKLAMKVILQACYYRGATALVRKRELADECLRSVNKHRWYRDVIPRSAAIG